jgi:tRNA(adenine34) deaminase
MQRCFELAQLGAGNVAPNPMVGAVLVHEGRIIARAYNQVEQLKDATAHAEILAITQAEAVLEDWRLTGCDLYVTKEPCPMCAGAIVHTRLRRVIFGCPDPRGGGAGGLVNILQMPQLNHRCIITSGILADECAGLLRDFFRAKREEAGVMKLTTDDTEERPI